VADPNKEKFISTLAEAVAAGGFVKLTLAKYSGEEADLKNVYVRRVALKKGERLSFLYRYKTKDVVKNLTVAEGLELISERLGSEFQSAHLFTTREDAQLDINRKRESKLVTRTPTFDTTQPASHDRKKRRAIETGCSVYLQALGVTDERGTARPAMGDKLRQINKFVETLAGLVASSPLAGREKLSVVDMGSGKGYLTFAVYDYLNISLGVRATVTGIEARAELVKLCNETAALAGFDRLDFRAGFIHDFDLPDTDILIALHACDTATDDAIFKGIRAGASVIITAPCCHKEVRPQIKSPAELRGVLRHGILLDREAEALTDSLRALLLEYAGYDVKVFEFITTEHTRKNTMIVAVRREGVVNIEAKLSEFDELKKFFGVSEQRLERLLLGGCGLR
jgi:SAM-dependent methyltransferase